jgi:hypothetical protein
MTQWSWTSVCCSALDQCQSITTLSLEHGRLAYRGWCADPSFGGGYWIADQEPDDFLANGPAGPVPAEVVDAIRARLP